MSATGSEDEYDLLPDPFEGIDWNTVPELSFASQPSASTSGSIPAPVEPTRRSIWPSHVLERYSSYIDYLFAKARQWDDSYSWYDPDHEELYDTYNYDPFVPYFMDELEEEFAADRQRLLSRKESNGESSRPRLRLP